MQCWCLEIFSDVVWTFINNEISKGVGKKKQSLSQILDLGVLFEWGILVQTFCQVVCLTPPRGQGKLERLEVVRVCKESVTQRFLEAHVALDSCEWFHCRISKKKSNIIPSDIHIFLKYVRKLHFCWKEEFLNSLSDANVNMWIHSKCQVKFAVDYYTVHKEMHNMCKGHEMMSHLTSIIQ